MAKRQSAQSKALETLKKIAEMQGATLDLSSVQEIRERSSGSQAREAESVMRSLHKPHAYMMKKCKRHTCKQPFETNYCSSAYCSDACLAEDLREIGIAYDPYSKKRWESSMFASDSGVMWRYEPPEYISTQTLLELEVVFRAFLADLDRLRGLAVEEESERNRKILESLGSDWDSPPEPRVSDSPQASPLVPEPLLQQSHSLDDDSLTNLFGEPQQATVDLDFFA